MNRNFSSSEQNRATKQTSIIRPSEMGIKGDPANQFAALAGMAGDPDAVELGRRLLAANKSGKGKQARKAIKAVVPAKSKSKTVTAPTSPHGGGKSKAVKGEIVTGRRADDIILVTEAGAYRTPSFAGLSADIGVISLIDGQSFSYLVASEYKSFKTQPVQFKHLSAILVDELKVLDDLFGKYAEDQRVLAGVALAGVVDDLIKKTQRRLERRERRKARAVSVPAAEPVPAA